MATHETGSDALKARSLFDATIELLKAHPLPLAVPLVLMGVLGSGGAGPSGLDAFAWDDPGMWLLLPLLLLMLIVLAVVLVVLVVLHGVASLVTTQAALDASTGQTPDIQQAWRTMRPQLAGGLLTFLLFVLLVLVGFALIVLPGIFLIAAWAPLLAVVLAERTTGPDALRRAWQLTDGHRLDLFLLNLGAFGIALAGTIVFGWFPIVGSVLAGVISGAASAFVVVLGAVFYRRKVGAVAAAAEATPDASS